MKTMMGLGLALCLGLVSAVEAGAQPNVRQERVVVSAQKRAPTELPGVRLVRKGDSLLLAVRLINDSLEPARRKEELQKTLANMLRAAAKDKTIDLSVVDSEGYVVPVNSINQNVDILGSTAVRGMSHIDIRLKTAIPSQAIDGQALVKRLRSFVKSTQKVGRTVINATGAVDISILNPEQYRADVIKLITAEIKLVTAQLGSGYKVVLDGLEAPLEWRRAGIVDVELYIPYRFRVVPESVTSL